MILAPLLAAVIVFTLPTSGQLKVVTPSAQGDSIGYECSGGQAIHQLTTATLYFIPLTGGGWRAVQSHSIAGKEGRPDSFAVSMGGHYYVTASNPVGESCASEMAYVVDPTVTGIDPDQQSYDRIVRSELFDVQGRRIQKQYRSGVYWSVDIYASGRIVAHKKVLLK